MREDLPRPQSTRSGDEEDEEEEEEEEDETEGRTARTRNRGSVCPVRTGQNSIIDSPNTPCRSPVLSPNEGLLNLGRQPETGSCTSRLVPTSPLSPPRPSEPVERGIAVGGAVNQSGTPGPALTRHLPGESGQTPGLPFNSSFSFIQQSLSASQGKATADTPLPVRQASEHLTSSLAPVSLATAQSKPQTSPTVGRTLPKPSLPGPAPGARSQREELFWQEGQWGGRMEALPDLHDCEGFSLGTEFPSSQSVNSDTASSVTSGYESATPASEPGWDHLVKKYEGILQGCLQNNRANTQVSWMHPNELLFTLFCM